MVSRWNLRYTAYHYSKEQTHFWPHSNEPLIHKSMHGQVWLFQFAWNVPGPSTVVPGLSPGPVIEMALINSEQSCFRSMTIPNIFLPRGSILPVCLPHLFSPGLSSGTGNYIKTLWWHLQSVRFPLPLQPWNCRKLSSGYRGWQVELKFKRDWALESV